MKDNRLPFRKRFGMAKAFCNEEQKRQRRKDDESEDSKEEERPKDTWPAFQDAKKTIATIFRGYAASESKRSIGHVDHQVRHGRQS